METSLALLHLLTSESAVDVTSMLLNMSPSMLGDRFCNASNSLHFGGGFSGMTLPPEMQGNNMMSNVRHSDDDQWDHAVPSIGFPFSLPLPMNIMGDAWRPSLAWDSCPSTEMSTGFCSTKCYT
ncbi:hypothetical protein HRI_002407400 [Hibiscus trionum]|uniref:Uncharacterized protein n=1 Tax=Hibiscus trionum TaxID=183268 RepID=A0A9W7M4L0_HIBTR|nr:hypothetical protein HRI_002407400 [Hibiscus trionum]